LFPTGAIIFTERVKAFFDVHPLIHLLTFGGHDVGCRVAIKALEQYDHIKPWENARRQGEKLKQKLNEIAATNTAITSVNGMGLLLGINFISAEAASAFCRNAIKNGIYVKTGEVAKNSVIIRPPLTITDQDVEDIIKGMRTLG